MPRVFISYSRDDLPFVGRLAQDLRACGAALWLDQEEISAGEDWTDAVWEGLKACDLLLLVISPASMDSREVASEWKYYLNNRKPILPLLAAATAHIHYQVSALQYVDFCAAPYETALHDLLAEINARLGTNYAARAGHPAASNRGAGGARAKRAARASGGRQTHDSGRPGVGAPA